MTIWHKKTLLAQNLPLTKQRINFINIKNKIGD
jgi:hypothetical protein